MFVFLIVWAGAKQSRSPGAEQPTQVRVYQLPVGVDGLASLALVNMAKIRVLCSSPDDSVAGWKQTREKELDILKNNILAFFIKWYY